MTAGGVSTPTGIVATISISFCVFMSGCSQISSLPARHITYNPYPPGLLPADMQSEISRVQEEIDRLEIEALAQFRALPDNPGTQKRQLELLGKIELYDKNLSVNRNVACSFCHMPYTGFSGPISSLNNTTVAYPGSVLDRFGKRKPQGYTYSPFYPPLTYRKTVGDFYGGNFWDLRATGYKLQSPDAEQAQGPPHDTQEMGMPDTACIPYRISTGQYAAIFSAVWGTQAFDIHWPDNVQQVCNTPAGASVFNGNQTPLSLTAADRGRAKAAYDQYAIAITSYESSPDISPFSSKFDSAVANSGSTILQPNEQRGWELFRGKAMCNTCHLDGTANLGSSSNGAITTASMTDKGPLFTDFTSANLGLPRNPSNPFYYQSTPDSFGFVGNPAGQNFVDSGVGLFLAGKSGTPPDGEWAQYAQKYDGFMQVSTLRNVDMRPYPAFIKSYMHNGYLKSLKEVVHFYNTRDVYPFPVQSGHCPAGTREKVTCWPMPEVTNGMDMSVGKLDLTDSEENDLVAFLQTLTDGYKTPYTDGNSFTGAKPLATSSVNK